MNKYFFKINLFFILFALSADASAQYCLNSAGRGMYLNCSNANQAYTMTLNFDALKGCPKTKQKFTNLRELDIKWDIGLTFLKTNPDLPNLKVLKISLNNAEEVPACVWTYTTLETLIINSGLNVKIPESINQLVNLTDLRIYECFKLNALPIDSKKLKKLKILHLSGKWNDFNKFLLPDEIFKLENLEELALTLGWGQQPLPQISKLKNLKVFSLWANHLEKLDSNIFNLANLEEFNVAWNFELKSVPKEIGKLKKLKVLELDALYKITSLPDEICELKLLEELYMEECRELPRLPENIGKLSALKKINIVDCHKLKELPASFGYLSSLKELQLNFKGKKLPSTFGELKSLEGIYLIDCENLDPVSTLKVLSGCKKLDKISMKIKTNKLPPEWCGLQNIKLAWFLIDNKHFDWNSISALALTDSLKGLNIECEDINPSKLFTALSSSPVKQLRLGHSLTSIPNEIEYMQNLEELNVSENQISFVHENIGKLFNLKKLDLSKQFTGSRHSEISNAKYYLSKIPESISGLKNLKDLDLSGNMLPAEYIKELRSKMPGCNIDYIEW